MPATPRNLPPGALVLLAYTACFSPVGSPEAGTTTAPTTSETTTTGASPTETAPPAATSTGDTTDITTDTTTGDTTGTMTGLTSTASTGTGDTATTDTSTVTTESDSPVCGDGKLAGDELCDEGAENGPDKFCTPDCKPYTCGDGYRCPNCEAREECDDGNVNPGDGCSPGCLIEGHIIFVTPTTFPGNVTVAQADKVCQDLGAAHFVPSRNFIAWLSSANASIANRIGQPLESYRLPGGELVASNTKALLSGGVAREVDQDPAGKALKGEASCMEANLVWTGSQVTGATDSERCADWTEALAGNGLAGSFKSTGAAWTHLCSAMCSMSLHLYCIQIG